MTLKVESECLMTSLIGITPDCEAGTAKPDPTASALSLKGLHTIPKTHETKEHVEQQQNNNNNNQSFRVSIFVSKRDAYSYSVATDRLKQNLTFLGLTLSE